MTTKKNTESRSESPILLLLLQFFFTDRQTEQSDSWQSTAAVCTHHWHVLSAVRDAPAPASLAMHAIMAQFQMFVVSMKQISPFHSI